MPKKDGARPWMAKFQEVQKQPSSQTAKANAMRHEPMKAGKSPLQRYMMSKKKQYGNQAKSYNVGRTRRAA